MTTPTAQRCQTCGEPADNELHDTSVYQSGYTVNGLFGTHAFVSPQAEEAPRRFTEAALVKCGCNHFRGNHGTIFQEIAERSGACLVDGCSCLIYHRALGDTETPHAPTDECFDLDPAPHTFEEVVAMADRLAAPLDSGPREPTPQQLLWDHCTAFITTQRVSCAEAVYQTDRVIENAYEFIEKVGEIVGWHNDDD